MKNKKQQKIVRFNPDYTFGLTNEQVKQRKQEGLVNKTKVTYGKSYGEIIVSNIFSFFNILLFIIAGFLIYARQFQSLFFLLILLPNMFIGLFQDLHARKLMGKLRLVTESNVLVVREGDEQYIKASELVLDDIVIFNTSNQIVADGTVVEGTLAVNESLLTGESVDVYVGPGDSVLSGSYVTSGKAYVRLEKVGKDSYVENLQNKANKFKRSPSQILKSLRYLFRGIGIIVIVLAFFMIITYAIQGKFSSYESLRAAIASISGSMVSMIPSGLYLLTSVALAVGVINLSKKRTSVQELYSIEMLARVDVLCVDKTGTITDGSMKVKKILSLANYTEPQINQIVSNILSATQDDNDTAKSLKKYFSFEQSNDAVATLPFNSKNKYSGATFKGKGTFVLGAIEFVNLKNKKGVQYIANEYASKGFRILVLAHSNTPIVGNSFVGECEAIALIVIKDNVRADAIETFKWFKENNVQIKVISGDNALTVSEVAKEAGVEGASKYISLENKSLEEVKLLVDEYNVFGRVTPEQKEVIINTLKELGKTVAMTGDGVNDILALKRADCSIAMASGSDAARNVSHIVLMDSNFNRLPSVVAEGRRVINNLQRTSSLFLIKTCFAMVLTVFFLIMSLFDNSVSYPLLTNHMYMWELITIGLSSFFLALQPNIELVKGKFLRNILKKALPAGLCSVFMVLFFFTFYFLTKYDVGYFGISTQIIESIDASGNLIRTDVGLAQTIFMCVIAFTVFSYISLFVICAPLNKYRLVVIGSAVILNIIVLLADLFIIKPMLGHSIFMINYEFTNPFIIFAPIILVLTVSTIYLFINYTIFTIKERKNVSYENQ